VKFRPCTRNILQNSNLALNFSEEGTEECPVKSVVNRVAVQLAKALQNKGMALLVNHGISEEKVEFVGEFDDIRTKFYGTFS
jgi:isopenicillin N synthase-like dioxygenase